MTIPLTKPQFVVLCSVLGALLAAAPLIYWFGMRPENNRKACSAHAFAAVKQRYDYTSVNGNLYLTDSDILSWGGEVTGMYNETYVGCLNNHGTE